MRNPKVNIKDAINFWMHVGDGLGYATGGVKLIGDKHGGGSPIMERIAITTQYDIGARKKMVKRLAGLTG